MSEHRRLARMPVVIVAVVAVLLGSQPAFAVRLVRFAVSINGRNVLNASTSDHGEVADTVWWYLKGLEFGPVRGYHVQANTEDSLRATLQGKVIIEAVYGGKAEVSALKLVRETDGARWKVAPAEVERTFRIRNKPLHLTLSIDGKVVLLNATMWAVGKDADTVWRNLKRVELRPFQQNKVHADPDDPLRGTLRGNVTIRVAVGGCTGERAEVSELKLVRAKANARWKIAPAEIERTIQNRQKPR